MSGERDVDRIPALFVTGAPGSGKTALIKEISEQLYRAGEFHAVIDLDELCRGVLPEGGGDFGLDIAVENLRAVWPNFARRGAKRLLLARIVLSASDVERIRSALPGCDVTVCRLVVGADTLQQRIRHREAGSSAEFLSSVAEGLASVIDGLDVEALVVRNDAATSITDVGIEVIEAIGWPRRPEKGEGDEKRQR